MKSERKNALVAEILGITLCDRWKPFVHVLSGSFEKKCDCKNCRPVQLGYPKYDKNLNLMWEAEETLTHEQAAKYQDILIKVCVTIDKLFRSGTKSGLDGYVIHASASQRQDAFLELFGKLEQ